ncbi:Glycoside hydrolase, 38 vacuolar alpha mannosidase [Savitreella phatthalungensis]
MTNVPPLSRYAPSGVQGPDIRHILRDRLNNFLNDTDYGDVNLRKFMWRGHSDEAEHISIKVYSVPGLDRPAFKDVVGAKGVSFLPTSKGHSFGPSWSTHWFEVKINGYPAEWEDYEDSLVLKFDLAEGLVYSADGQVLQGLTGTAADGSAQRIEFVLADKPAEFKPVTLFIEQSCNGLFGNGQNGTIQPPTDGRYFELRQCAVAVPNLAAVALWYDFEIIRDCSDKLPPDSRDSWLALDVCTRIMDAFDRDKAESIEVCRKIAREYIGDINRSSHEAHAADQIAAIGNTHIDTAWLWPFAETRRKIARSWSAQLDLLSRYPEMIFTASQAQQFQWLLEDHPELFARVKDAVQKQRFEPVGGCWVEMDTNLPSGESLCRQFLQGQLFFREHFGRTSQIFWLPDTFGYSAALPQLARLAGMRFFFTQKLSWNNINDFPHSTFRWVGLDGSQVICHMAPTNTYNAECRVEEVRKSETDHKSLRQCSDAILAYGFGDGGGGPTVDMLERLRRLRGASNHGAAHCLPRIGHSTVQKFFERVEVATNSGQSLKAWHGELYLEFHRGTYTSHGQTKANNASCERLLHDLEWFASLAALKKVKGYSYPHSHLKAMWRDVLLCQFHDVLPGSAIEMVYRDADTIYASVRDRASKLLAKACSALGMTSNSTAEGKPCLLGATHNDAILVHREPSGRATLFVSRNGQLVEPSLRGAVYAIENDGAIELQNTSLKVRIRHGEIESMVDLKRGRELLSEPAGFALFEDEPLNWQAWDVELTYLLKAPRRLKADATLSIKSDESGKHAAVLCRYEISKDTHLEVEFSLRADTDADEPANVWSQVSIACTAEWHENKRMLRFLVPTTLHAPVYHVGTQFGRQSHPTNTNTTWEEAKFEVCHHGWFDLSEANSGLSILTQDKYGCAVHNADMSLALLRAPKAPDANCDMGKHTFRFAMAFHRAPLAVVRMQAKAEEFATAVRIGRRPEDLDVRHIYLRGLDTVHISAVKQAEDGDGLIVRVFESAGARGKVRVHCTAAPISTAYIVNILEDRLTDVKCIAIDPHSFDLDMAPFEVKTIRITVA